MCAVSLLRMQTMLMTSADPIRADMHFVSTLDDALNCLRANKDAVGALMVEGGIGFDPSFGLEAMKSGMPLVAGVYPLPVVDWERVKTQPANEVPQHWGNVYNVKPAGSPGPNGYLPVTDAALGVVWVSADVVRSIESRHPEIVTADGSSAAFARAGVYAGVRREAHERFLDLWAGPVYADPNRQCSSSGPAEFGGCVGARTVLR